MTRAPDWTTAASLPPDELARLLDEDHDEVDDNPPLTDDQLAAAVPGRRRPGQRGPGKRQAKVLVSLRIDPEALAALKASGEGWASRAAAAVEREALGKR